MFAPPSGTGRPGSVAGSAVNMWLGTWQVPHDCLPDTERLGSKKIALPAIEASDCAGAGGVAAPVSGLLPPPQLDRAALSAHARAARSHPVHFFDVIRLCPRRFRRLRINTIANAIENYSYLQF